MVKPCAVLSLSTLFVCLGLGVTQACGIPLPQDQGSAEQVQQAVQKALRQKATGDQEGALLTLQQGLAETPRSEVLLNDIAAQALSLNHLKVADTAARQALAINPANLDTLYALARIESDEDLLPASLKDFELYLAARPDDASAHYGLGHLLQRNQETDRAAEEFHRSVALQPQQTESYYQLGQMALDAHHDQEAEELFERVLKRAPEHGGALTGLGILRYRAHRYADARGFLTRGIAASPEYQPAHYYLGLALSHLGEKDQAEQQLNQARELAQKQQGKSRALPQEN